jgi:hypothetical protein
MMTTTRQLPWSLDDIAWDRIERDRIRDDDALFLLLASASFIESGSDTYTGNLVEHFADDAEVGTWLRTHWEPEELQHGRALRTYVQLVWPEFDWAPAYAAFFADYARLCTMEELEPTHGQEMAARCIVEMGTTTYYQALHEAASEPVLRDLAWRIRCDEVRHYKHFHAFFQACQRRERLGRGPVLAALVRRAIELRSEDAKIALRHVTAWHWRGRRGAVPADAELARQAYRVVSRHLPMELAVKMAIKPLCLSPGVQRWVARPLAALGSAIVRP